MYILYFLIRAGASPPLIRAKPERQHFFLKEVFLNPSTNSCRLCLVEKFTIMFKPELASLNQRDEFFTHWRIKEAKLLDKT